MADCINQLQIDFRGRTVYYYIKVPDRQAHSTGGDRRTDDTVYFIRVRKSRDIDRPEHSEAFSPLNSPELQHCWLMLVKVDESEWMVWCGWLAGLMEVPYGGLTSY